MTYLKILSKQIEASVSGKMHDSDWNNRESKTITCAMTYTEAIETFVDDIAWSIIYQADSYTNPETNEVVTPDPVEYDNSDYCVAGPITDNRNGTVSIKMGKRTDAEILAILEEAIR